MTFVLNGYRWSSSLHADAQMEADIDEGRKAKADAAAALGVQAKNLQTVRQHNPDMAARTRDGIDVLASPPSQTAWISLSSCLRTATVNAGTQQGAFRSLFVDMVRKLSLGHAYLVGPDLLDAGLCGPKGHADQVGDGALPDAFHSPRNRHFYNRLFFLDGEMAAHSFGGITNRRYSRTQLLDCGVETIGPISDLIIFDQSDEFLILCELSFVI